MIRLAATIGLAVFFSGSVALAQSTAAQPIGPSTLASSGDGGSGGVIVVPSGGSIQAALTEAGTLGGAPIYVTGGATYPQTSMLTIASNTRLVCDPGATLTANSASWSGTKAFIENVNWSASSLTDHDITIEGCTFVTQGTFVTDGAWHSVAIRQASHVSVSNNNSFSGGGDGVSLQATVDTHIYANHMTGAINACWDHWEAPTHLSVRDNDCTTTLYGILVTGTDTAHTLAGQALSGIVSGNRISITGGASVGLGIWLNGLGAAGSGASAIHVIGNTIIGDSTQNLVCWEVTGASVDDQIIGNTCKNSGSNSVGFLAGNDAGGTTSEGIFANNILDNVNTQASNVASIKLAGPDWQAFGNTLTNSTTQACLRLSSTNNVAIANKCSGFTAEFNLTGATSPMAIDFTQTTAAGTSPCPSTITTNAGAQTVNSCFVVNNGTTAHDVPLF